MGPGRPNRSLECREQNTKSIRAVRAVSSISTIRWTSSSGKSGVTRITTRSNAARCHQKPQSKWCPASTSVPPWGNAPRGGVQRLDGKRPVPLVGKRHRRPQPNPGPRRKRAGKMNGLVREGPRHPGSSQHVDRTGRRWPCALRAFFDAIAKAQDCRPHRVVRAGSPHEIAAGVQQRARSGGRRQFGRTFQKRVSLLEPGELQADLSGGSRQFGRSDVRWRKPVDDLLGAMCFAADEPSARTLQQAIRRQTSGLRCGTATALLVAPPASAGARPHAGHRRCGICGSIGDSRAGVGGRAHARQQFAGVAAQRGLPGGRERLRSRFPLPAKPVQDRRARQSKFCGKRIDVDGPIDSLHGAVEKPLIELEARETVQGVRIVGIFAQQRLEQVAGFRAVPFAVSVDGPNAHPRRPARMVGAFAGHLGTQKSIETDRIRRVAVRLGGSRGTAIGVVIEADHRHECKVRVPGDLREEVTVLADGQRLVEPATQLDDLAPDKRRAPVEQRPVVHESPIERSAEQSLDLSIRGEQPRAPVHDQCRGMAGARVDHGRHEMTVVGVVVVEKAQPVAARRQQAHVRCECPWQRTFAADDSSDMTRRRGNDGNGGWPPPVASTTIVSTSG